MNLVLTARLEIQTNQHSPIVSHMRWSLFAGCDIPRNVLQADSIVVSCGLANFEQSSWSTHRRHEFWGTHEEFHTKEDYDKFVRSFKNNYSGMCDGRSIWTIDCRKFDDPDNNWSLRKRIGRNPRIMMSILESENYHALHRRLYDGMHWSFSSKKRRDDDMQGWTTPLCCKR